MTQALLYSTLGIALFGIGLFALICAPHIIKKILAVNVSGIGVFMLLIANANSPGGVIDPVPHAMVLTGIVVAVAGTALGLFLLCKLNAHDSQHQQGSR